MHKRALMAASDAMAALIVACLASCAFVTPAYAYIDPSVMTYTIQAIAGVAVALSAVAGVALRRGRKVLLRILDIDENARREQEPDVHRVLADGTVVIEEEATPARPLYSSPKVSQPALERARAAGVQTAAIAGSEGTQDDSASEGKSRKARVFRKRSSSGAKRYAPNLKERLIYGLIAGVFFTFTIFFVAPLEIVAGSSSSLIYSMGDVWWVLLAPDLGIIALIVGVLALLRGRAFNFALVAVVAVGLCTYVQALVLNVGLPAADGATIVWADYMVMQIVSASVWIAIILGFIIYALLNARRAQGVAAIVSVFLILVQAVGLASLAIAPVGGGETPKGGKVVMTEDQMFTVNPDHNVVVFILDTYDTAYLTSVLKTNPNLLDGLTGFTNYENATSAMIPTRFAVPEMMTGQMPSFDENFSTYKAERYARSDFLQKIYDANYSIGLYSDSLTIGRLSSEEQYGITSKTVNMHDLPDSMMNVGGTLYSLYQMGLYRDMMWPFKWAFWYYTDQINQMMVLYEDNALPEETIYVMDDVRYYNRLCEFGLSLEEGKYAGAYRFIHLQGSHYPFSYDEDVNDLGEDNSNVFKQSQGVIKIVTTYIDELKRLGVYENTTIIITADHGYWTITLDPIEETSTPIMFVKPEQSAAADARPIKVDEKPVSHLDLQATVLDAMGLDWSEYSSRDEWAGYSMLGPIDPKRKRYYLTTDSEPDLTEVQFREYLIDGNALDWDNWSETGRTIDAQK
ncbi:MAG: sulfatase-like hydrolase/transferase [Eggerthellaceae bacterium]|nr:sulfatase-like hydrolase/transferase [Eggerthellaceae bacterium]